MTTTAYIALGANLGQKRLNMESAAVMIAQLPATTITASSDLITTAPVGGPPGQPKFLNAVLQVRTGLTARQLLEALLQIEQVLGRDRAEEPRHGPRVIDLDLLLYGDAILDEPGLTVPHPRMHERAFVLKPLASIAPDVRHPVLKQTAAELWAALKPARKAPRRKSP